MRLKPRGDLPEDKLKESVIESLTSTHITFKDTTGSNKFSKIFNEVSQLDMYTETMQDLTTELFAEKDSVFFTLGPSNSGKSYSIYGDASNPGLAIYSLNQIFNEIGDNYADYKHLKGHFGESFLVTSSSSKESKGEFGLSISVFEIYNDRIRDLSLDQKKTMNQSLDIITDIKDGKIKPNKIRQIYVTNLDDAKTVLHKCIKRRAVSATNLNITSSRSHLFIYFNLHKVIGKAIRTTRLTIADLAGSERTKSAKTEGKEFKEGNYTNTSLTELGRCLALMKSKKFDRSILRTSKLTRLLLTDLFGNINMQNRIKILLTLDPYSNLSTILHAIRYIQPVAKMQITSERNSLDTNLMDNHQVSQLMEELKMLRAINDKLEADKETAMERMLEVEMDIRNELSEQYEKKIQEIETLHATSLNELKESHQADIDTKLKILSDDYDAKIKELREKYEVEIDELLAEHRQHIINIKAEHDVELKKLGASTSEATTSQTAVITKFEAHLAKIKKEKEQLEEDLSKEKSELESKLHAVIAKLDEAEKEINHLAKKEKKKEKKIEDLTEELNDLRKRKSDATDFMPQNKKVRFSEVEEGQAVASSTEEVSSAVLTENKENSISDPLLLSPIKLIRSSPNKHFKFEDDSPKKSPVKKTTLSSPTKRAVLQETNIDFTMPSSKTKTKSPSKKKKLNNVPVVDTSMD